MKKQRGAVDRIGRLADTLSEMAAPFGYRIVPVSDPWELSLALFGKALSQHMADFCREIAYNNSKKQYHRRR